MEFFLSARVTRTQHDRQLAIGRIDGSVVIAVVFRPLGTEAISVISMRRAGYRERSRSND
ncbi:hypothetical protein C7I84_01350 [Mesorhizobium ephedrae]|uniref:BrnT family toxin n=1 Tax=Kumtagia ephedrae TaxID=2116701 RepID=A0A2P7STX6_9HYPH|nr:hypothetical protein C7I84_01350 [Mesorhizobium ephedrae]